MRRKSPVSKYGAKRSYHDHFAPERGQSGQAIKILRNLNMTKYKKICQLRHWDNVVYYRF